MCNAGIKESHYQYKAENQLKHLQISQHFVFTFKESGSDNLSEMLACLQHVFNKQLTPYDADSAQTLLCLHKAKLAFAIFSSDCDKFRFILQPQHNQTLSENASDAFFETSLK